MKFLCKTAHRTKDKEKQMVTALPPMALHYNKWNELENSDVCKLFTRMEFAEIALLQSGEEIWYDQDPIYHHGKVYGYVRRTVDSIEILSDSELRLHFKNGFRLITQNDRGLIYKLDNPEALVKMVAGDPRIGNC